MDEQEVVALMKSSKSEAEWGANCDKVKTACKGYPASWYKSIILSGLCDEVVSKFGRSSAITISTEEK